jgi:hypothetical protein
MQSAAALQTSNLSDGLRPTWRSFYADQDLALMKERPHRGWAVGRPDRYG